MIRAFLCVAISSSSVAMTGCGGAQSKGEGVASPEPAGPVSYEDASVPLLLMTKPDGKHVRTSGAWGDVQPNVPGIGPDAFGVYFYDNASILALSVPTSLAAEAEHFAHGQAVTVEGRFENRTPFPIVHVDRFVEATP